MGVMEDRVNKDKRELGFLLLAKLKEKTVKIRQNEKVGDAGGIYRCRDIRAGED